MRTDLTDAQADLLSTALMVDATSGIIFWLVVFVGFCIICKELYGQP